MLRRLVCKIMGHRVNRQRVWHDGLSMRAKCRVCFTPMIRGRHAWREFDTRSDASAKRRPHPRAS